jgi:hypothetical protein
VPAIATKTEVKPENRGDVALLDRNTPDAIVDYARIKNVKQFRRNVRPGDVVNKKERTADYAFFWVREVPGDEFAEEEVASCLDKGYFFVNEKDFEVKRWSRSADGRITSGRYFLMAIPEDKYQEHQLDRLRSLGAILDEQAQAFHATAEQTGVGTWETRGGKTREVVKPKKQINLD